MFVESFSAICEMLFPTIFKFVDEDKMNVSFVCVLLMTYRDIDCI